MVMSMRLRIALMRGKAILRLTTTQQSNRMPRFELLSIPAVVFVTSDNNH
jgi:hypothetical protein